ncbi:MAG: glycosyltransferase [Anaerolineae bacterium]|nr:glycosyltransferase [Anaerolineae bacterium]
MKSESQISFIVTSTNNRETLRATLDSILSQQGTFECFVVDAGSTDASSDILREYADRLTYFEIVGAEESVTAVNRAFARSSGELFWWLSGGEKLCPWAARLASFVFDKLEQIHWLTSGTPVTWTPTQLCVPTGLADGYAKIPFFQGRNLKTSPYFRQPIWRSGTVWRRGLWLTAGGYVADALEQAGDFELWIRFWQAHALLYTMNIPLAGVQSAARPIDEDVYWRAATAHLEAVARLPAPTPWQVKLRSQMMRRFPKKLRPYTSMAHHIRIAPSTLDCATITLPLL